MKQDQFKDQLSFALQDGQIKQKLSDKVQALKDLGLENLILDGFGLNYMDESYDIYSRLNEPSYVKNCLERWKTMQKEYPPEEKTIEEVVTLLQDIVAYNTQGTDIVGDAAAFDMT